MFNKTYPIALSLVLIAACQTTPADTDVAKDLAIQAVEDKSPKEFNSAGLDDFEMASIDNGVEEATPSPTVVEGEGPNVADASVEPIIEEAVSTLSYPSLQLRRGESLAHFARWSGVPVEEIASSSGLELDGEYAVGQEIILPISQESLAEVEKARDTHRVKRVEGYLASRGGSDKSDFYTVKTGDTAWSIAKSQQRLPLWLLESYNPNVDLDKLRPGQELMVPVLSDTVVDAE